MALWVCKRCGCRFAVGLNWCPQCTGTDVEEDGMAKITVHGGPSDKTLPREEPVEEEVSVAVEDEDVEAGPVDEVPVARPAVNASKADWVTWAVSQGADPDEAEASTKQQLIDMF